MKKAKKPAPSAAERLLATKRKHVERLRREITDIRADSETKVRKVEGRIRVSQTLIDALERGTLKP